MATSVLLLVHDTLTEMIDGADGEAKVDVFLGLDEIFEVGRVTSTDVRGTLEKMTDDQRACKLIELVGGPAVPPSDRCC